MNKLSESELELLRMNREKAERIGELEQQLADCQSKYESEMRTQSVFETCVEQMETAMHGLEDEFLHFPEAITKLRQENQRLRDEIGMYQSWMKRHHCVDNKYTYWDEITDDYPYLKDMVDWE